MNRRLASFAAFALIAAATSMNPAHAQISTAFTYQAQLNDAGAPYSGSADVQFRLFAGPADPTQIGPTLAATNLTCVEGRFTTTLNFLNMVPPGGHIEISIRTPHDPTNTAPFITLTPRQPVTAAPQAFRAEEATYADAANLAANALSLGGQLPAYYLDAANITGTIPSARLSGSYTQSIGFTNPGNAFSGSGAGLTALNANNILTGTLPPARGGTGSSIPSATTGHVLKWNGSAFTPQPDLDTDTTYSAGAGLSLTSTTFSIPTDGVNSAMILNNAVTNLDLSSDAASLSKVSGGAMSISGGTATLGTAAPALAVQSTTNGGSARVDLFETVGLGGVGGRMLYDGAANVLHLGTVDSGGGPLVSALSINRNSPDASFARDISVGRNIIIPATTRSIMVPGSAFTRTSEGGDFYRDYHGLTNSDPNINNGFFAAPLTLPDGAVITGFTVYAVDNVFNGALTAELVSLVVLSGGLTNVATVSTSGEAPEVRTFSPVTPVSHTVTNATRALTLRAYWGAPAVPSQLVLVAIRIDYTITSPLP
jgi:hypothetical protein